MVEMEFERRLERLFAEAPDFPDAGDFAARVDRRLDAGWTARRWLIGAAGVAGGVIGASQLMMSNVFHRVESASDSALMLSSGLSRMTPRTDWLDAVSGGGSVVWLAAGMAVVTMGFVVSRVIGEL